MADLDFTVLIDCKNHLTTNDIDNRSYEYGSVNDNITSVSYDLAASFYDRGIDFILKLVNSVYPTHIGELSVFIESIYDLVSSLLIGILKNMILVFMSKGLNIRFHLKK